MRIGWFREEVTGLLDDLEEQWGNQVTKGVEDKLAESFFGQESDASVRVAIQRVAEDIERDSGPHAVGRWAMAMLKQAVELGAFESVEVLTFKDGEEVDGGGAASWGSEGAVTSEIFLADGSIIRMWLTPARPKSE